MQNLASVRCSNLCFTFYLQTTHNLQIYNLMFTWVLYKLELL